MTCGSQTKNKKETGWSWTTTVLCLVVQEDDFVARDEFEDADQLRIGNDGIFMLTFFSKNLCGNIFLLRSTVIDS